ncbi:hypothetical protein J3459_014231 [Metarhizium acridum]|nr:hypothetical protein J3459_014231 [Metarhizium acridum]
MSDDNLLSPEGQPSSNGGPYALFCQYCNWSSTDVGIKFDRPSGIHSQLGKLNNGGTPKITIRDVKERRKENPDEPPLPDDEVDRDLQFASLRAFYQEQLANSNPSLSGMPLQDSRRFSSPAALSRIMSLYTSRGHPGRMQQGPADVIREALNSEEGLKLAQLDESSMIKKLTNDGWQATTSSEQRAHQVSAGRFQDELRPIPYLLRTKRSKRCPACRHIISKPENKVTSTRFKIRLVAKSYIPTISSFALCIQLQRLYQSQSRPAFNDEATIETAQTVSVYSDLQKPHSLKASRGETRVRKRDEGAGQGEAAKIWERGRNWVSIILEVVPASLRPEHQTLLAKDKDEVDDSPLKEDEDILEIPMFIRMEWEADAQHDIVTAHGKDKEAKEKRELAYWCVLGVGRISHE